MNNMATSIKLMVLTTTTILTGIFSVQKVQAQQIIAHAAVGSPMLKAPAIQSVLTTDKGKSIVLMETEPVFEGGAQGWLEFLGKHLIYPENALAFDIWGNVDIEFTVNKDGTVSNVNMVSGKYEFRDEAERVIRLSSGKWDPARQNGYPVAYRQRQKIGFFLTIP
jgi:periplasmic protein TonB